jgi:AAA family ATP:ADP antiporter
VSGSEDNLTSRSTRDGGWRLLGRRLGIDIRPGEGAATALLFVCLFLLLTFQVSSETVRQSTFIDSLGADKLPLVYLLVAVLSYPVLRPYYRFAERFRVHQLIAISSLGVAAILVGFWALYQFPSTWVPVVFYVASSIIYAMMVSQFWSLVNHVFDARQAKRLFGIVGAGALVGGIAGGQVARLASSRFGTSSTLLIAAAILVVVALLMPALRRHHPETEKAGLSTKLDKLGRARGGMGTVLQSPLLKAIAALTILTVMVSQIVDLQFNWAVEQKITGLDQRTAFFGNFFSVTGIAALVFQLLFTAQIHRKLGVIFAVRVLPVAMAFGTGILIFSASLMPSALIGAALILKLSENGFRYSLDQATRELLYLPVPSRARLKAKAFIDVFLQRGAKGLAALLLLPVTIGVMSAVQAGWIAFVLIVAWLAVTVWLRREYVRSFRAGLKDQTADSGFPIDLTDASTLELMMQSLGSSDRRQVLNALDILAAQGRGDLISPLLLYHDEAEVRHKTLQILLESKRRDAAWLIERRLSDEDPEVRVQATRVLAELHGQNVTELMFPRLREADPGIRAAAVACLANHGDGEMMQSATEVIDDLISDSDPIVRREAAKAIGAVHEPRFQRRLIRLLYDRDPVVGREAIAAVRRRVARDGYNPLYAPTLISLLQDRRVKHEAREALVAFGETVLPALTHFMNDPDEAMWVRRALPKTIASIATPQAARILTRSLARENGTFERSKLVEALGVLRDSDDDIDFDVEAVHPQIVLEAQSYLERLILLDSLGSLGMARLEGALPVWDADHVPSLLDQLLKERLEDHLQNLFGLLALIFPAKDVWAAYQSLVSGQAKLRAHALEYLENTLEGELRRSVFAAIDDSTIHEKLDRAEKMFGVSAKSRAQALGQILSAHTEEREESANLVVAALYFIYTDGVSGLAKKIKNLIEETEDPFVRETSMWVSARIGLSAGS